MDNFIFQLLQRLRLALDSCSQMNWHWNWPDIARAWVGVGVLFTRGLYKHQVWVGTVLSPHLSIGLLSSWIIACFELVWSRISVFLNWRFWKGFVVFLELLGPQTDFVKMSLYWAILVSLKMAQKGLMSELLIVMILILRVKITVTMQEIFLLQRWMLFNLLGNSHACCGAGLQKGKKCIYVRLLSGNWKLEVKSEETLQSFHPSYQKAEDVNFFKVFLKISLKRLIRVKLQRCSANMNIKGPRIRNSRMYSNRGQTVWSCHPQFGEDFKNNYLKKNNFSRKVF